jgi:hypothetical protein
MTDHQLLLLFFGLPLAILGMGLRRALGWRALFLLILVSGGVAIYAVLLEAGLRAAGIGLPLAGAAARGIVLGFGPYAIGAALLGGLGGVLLRFQGRGATPSRPRPDQE